MKIEKLKDDLSNVAYSYNIHEHFIFRCQFLEDCRSEIEIISEQQELINSGYAKIIDGIFYCSKPNKYQQYIIDRLGI